MKFKLAGIIVVAAIFGLATQGCNKKGSESSGKGGSAKSGSDCASVCAKMKKCSDEFAEAAGKGMPKQAMDMMKKQMKKQFADTAKCEEQCKKSKNKAEDKKIMEKCMGKSDCKAFAECIIAESKKKAPAPPRIATPPAGDMAAPARPAGDMAAPARPAGDMAAPARPAGDMAAPARPAAADMAAPKK